MSYATEHVARAVAAIAAVTAGAVAAWGTYIAFTGGTLPILGLHLSGSNASGITWLFLFDPIIVLGAFALTRMGVLGLSDLFARPKSVPNE